MGYDVWRAGLSSSPRGIGSVMGAVIAGYLTSKIDPRKMIAFGFAVFVGGSLWHGLLTLDILPSSLEFRSQFRSFRSAPCSRSRQRGVLAEGSLRTFDGAILITAILALLTPLDPIICRSTTIGPPRIHKEVKNVYCKDDYRRRTYPNEKFDFLGYTFRPRRSKNREGKRPASVAARKEARCHSLRSARERSYAALHLPSCFPPIRTIFSPRAARASAQRHSQHFQRSDC